MGRRGGESGESPKVPEIIHSLFPPSLDLTEEGASVHISSTCCSSRKSSPRMAPSAHTTTLTPCSLLWALECHP